MPGALTCNDAQLQMRATPVGRGEPAEVPVVSDKSADRIRAELPPRTFCTFRRELSSLRKPSHVGDGRNVLE